MSSQVSSVSLSSSPSVSSIALPLKRRIYIIFGIVVFLGLTIGLPIGIYFGVVKKGGDKGEGNNNTTKCKKTSDCLGTNLGSTPYCNTATKSCVECLTSSNCTGSTATNTCNSDNMCICFPTAAANGDSVPTGGAPCQGNEICSSDGVCQGCESHLQCPQDQTNDTCDANGNCVCGDTGDSCVLGSEYPFCVQGECVQCRSGEASQDCGTNADRCNPDSNMCQCGTNGVCSTIEKPYCIDGECVECREDTDCKINSLDRPRCNTNTNSCVECLNSQQDCKAPTPVCYNDLCVECTTTSQCGKTATYCDIDKNLCMCGSGTPMCEDPTPYCYVPSNSDKSPYCVQCLEDENCSSTMVCHESTCSECRYDSQCPKGQCCKYDDDKGHFVCTSDSC